MFQLVIRNEIIHDDETKACENCRKREEALLVEFASDDEERQAEWLEENDLNLEELNIPQYK